MIFVFLMISLSFFFHFVASLFWQLWTAIFFDLTVALKLDILLKIDALKDDRIVNCQIIGILKKEGIFSNLNVSRIFVD